MVEKKVEKGTTSTKTKQWQYGFRKNEHFKDDGAEESIRAGTGWNRWQKCSELLASASSPGIFGLILPELVKLILTVKGLAKSLSAALVCAMQSAFTVAEVNMAL